MKKIIISLLMLIGITGAQAQEYEYVPLVREGVKWVYYVRMEKNNQVHWCPLTIEFSGDTILGRGAYAMYGHDTFKKCYMTIDPEFKDVWPMETDENGTFLAAMMRETNKRVFAIYTKNYRRPFAARQGFHYYATGLETGQFYGFQDSDDEFDIHFYEKLNEEWMVYDFNNPSVFVRQAIPYFNIETNEFYYRKAVEVNPITINGTTRKKFISAFDDESISIEDKSHLVLTEGVGFYLEENPRRLFSTFISPLGMLTDGGHYTEFSHVEESGNVVFQGPDYGKHNVPDAIKELNVDNTNKKDLNYYNINGQVVSTPTQPGIYIHQGKKLVIK
ncbi:MAG: hypothetical protein J5523_03650 [Muribaculaceae bacterium]|nr:hypothetical protein [Muribaculaceae bacterium]